MLRDELRERLTRAFSVVSKVPGTAPELVDVIDAAMSGIDAYVASELERKAQAIEAFTPPRPLPDTNHHGLWLAARIVRGGGDDDD